MDEAFCPQNLVMEDVTSTTTSTTTTPSVISSRIQQENGRDYKSIEYRKDQLNSSNSEKIAKRPVALPRVGFQKPVPLNHNIWRMRNYDKPLISSASNNIKSSVESIWTVKSGCHFSCMEQSAGVQVISSKLNSATNIQLCSSDILVNFEYIYLFFLLIFKFFSHAITFKPLISLQPLYVQNIVLKFVDYLEVECKFLQVSLILIGDVKLLVRMNTFIIDFI